MNRPTPTQLHNIILTEEIAPIINAALSMLRVASYRLADIGQVGISDHLFDISLKVDEVSQCVNERTKSKAVNALERKIRPDAVLSN